MGFLKKITRPISKVLDKIVPNEIKPALPFLAAAAPFLAPTAGIIGTMAGRAALAGGSNLLAQLAQEGSEGDFSLGSVALASGIGALSAPGAGDTLRGVNRLDEFGTAGDVYKGTQAAQAPSGFLGQGKEFLAKGADKLEGVIAAGKANPFSMEGLKAASIPITQGTTDLAIAENRRLEKQFAIDEALRAAEGLADDEARASAIRNAMIAYGFFTDEEIADTIASAGYRAGGRVALEKGGGPDFGGILAAIKNIEEGGEGEEMITIITEQGPVQVKKSVYESMPSMFVDTTTSAYGDNAAGRPVPEFAQGGLMNLGGKEMDLRGGGFVPIGKKERADDVPARLSKNEFVMTADAVRGAGGGDINKGAKRMYETMNKLEARV